MLSDAAEALLRPAESHHATAHRRSQFAPPKPRPLPSTKSATLQSHRERRLRRLARRATELCERPSGCGADSLHSKVTRDAHELGLSFDGDLRRLCESALSAAAELEAAAAATRVASWHRALQSDYPRMRQWVRREPAPAPGPLSDGPVHPSDVVAAEHAKWQALWTRAPAHSPTETRAWCLRLGPATPAWPDELLHPPAADVLACVRAAARRAAGLDDWTPPHLALLPLDFYELLSRLWSACLRHGAPPQAWAQVQITLLPKPDGSLRPLAIASALWRALSTVVVRRLRSWTLSWAPPALLGSIPGRSGAELHAAFAADVHRARRTRQAMAGYKADVQKCFDTVCVRQALEVARWLGAPPALLGLLEAFYRTQRRYVAWQGIYHPDAIRPTLGLLQGCPFSPLLLNGVISLWVRVVAQAAPTASLAAYLDDRTVWAVGPGAAGRVCEAARAGVAFDQFFGLRLHPEKLRSFAITSPARAAMLVQADLVGPLSTRFVLLGVHYAFGTTALPDTAALTVKVRLRCERIAVAAASPGLRRRLVQELVVPLFAWTGPWTAFKQGAVTAWASCIALALWGSKPPSARSRLLLWHVVGRPHLRPEHALDLATARQEWMRVSRPGRLVWGPSVPTPQWHAVMRKWGWHHAPTGDWHTPLGTLRPGWDGLHCLFRAANHAFLQRMWGQDPKTVEWDLAHSVPCFQPACLLAASADRSAMRTATACAADARVLLRLGEAQESLACSCGELLPTRTHLTFACAHQPWRLVQASPPERAILCRLLPLPLWHSPPDPGLDLEVVAALREAAVQGCVVCAADGGAFVHPQLASWQRAAWAFAFGVPSDFTVLGGLVAGFDQTPAAAERAALWQLLCHLRRANVTAYVFLDNRALVLRLQRGLARESWEGANPAFWASVATLASRDLQVSWVPSHGKLPAWEASQPELTHVARFLNGAADAKCTQLLRPLRPEWDAAVLRYEQACEWGQAACRAQHAACGSYHERLRQRLGEWNLAHRS